MKIGSVPPGLGGRARLEAGSEVILSAAKARKEGGPQDDKAVKIVRKLPKLNAVETASQVSSRA